MDTTLLWWSWLMFKVKQNKTKKWLHDEYKVKSWVDDKKLNHRP